MAKKKVLKIFVFTMLTAIILMSGISLGVPGVKAQAQATVVILSPSGGTVSPTTGTYNYTDGTDVTLTATPTADDSFVQWIVVDSTGATNIYTDNPLALTVSGGVAYTVETDFSAVQPPPVVPIYPVTGSTSSTDATVVVISGVGGTTSPAPGTYILANAADLNLTAIPDSGWVFDNWVIAGTPMNHGAYAFTDTPTNNPYNVNHGYGNTYSYEAVFTPISTSTSPTPTPKVPEFSSVAAIIVAALLIIIAMETYAFTKRNKK